ncbi:hypothetical protein K402DRAFT_441857 [Aulographum hederae CBS 113979]|uniref:non-specific serine/threonine protein kinase n=1 Tax=Aulographum hederae CBS 113979 TaxID=1176131 RepID=A0A6G1GJC2_9PEZI|nr:hypothetical protein K402DRAFT_441857 [Aulographum hederae CBS 113979]
MMNFNSLANFRGVDGFELQHDRVGMLGEGTNGIAELYETNRATRDARKGHRVVSKMKKREEGTPHPNSDGLRTLDIDFFGFCRSELEREGKIMEKFPAAQDNLVKALEYFPSFANDIQKDRLVIEYCDIGDLDAFLKPFRSRGGKLPEPYVWHLLKGIMKGLALLHSAEFEKVQGEAAWNRPAKTTSPGIVHKDIHVGNIFLVTNPDPWSTLPIVKIGDFGQARPLRGDGLDDDRLRIADVFDAIKSIVYAMGTDEAVVPYGNADNIDRTRAHLDRWAASDKYSPALLGILKKMLRSFNTRYTTPGYWMDTSRFVSEIEACMRQRPETLGDAEYDWGGQVANGTWNN